MTARDSTVTIVDTNVPIVANGKSHANRECVRSCSRALNTLVESGRVAIDDDWRIIQEYRGYLCDSGQPGLGDLFFKWLLTNRTNPKKCVLVPITPHAAEHTYIEFPDTDALENFDRDDRKFIAVAVAVGRHNVVLQAVDSEWWQVRDAMLDAGVNVYFLCLDEVR